ncbi:MAG: ergothioneine biosynthesis protein EgtB [Myxococcaceae bacterium]
MGAALEEARRRTLGLLAPLPDAALTVQHSPLMSPMVWDFAHVANYEEQWLLRALGASRVVHEEVDRIYDAFRHPRCTRTQLPLMGPAAARSYANSVREQVLAWLERLELDAHGGPEPLLKGAFVYRMVVQHEHQHAETLLATLRLMEQHRYRPAEAAPPRGRALPAREVRVPGGRYRIGADVDDWAYDNERPSHDVELAPFFLDTAPVSNADFGAFIEAGGYRDPRLWSEDGWRFVQEQRLEAPLYWRRDGSGSWVRRRFDRLEPVPPDTPVEHVCWFEADAFARWAGRRLPTELEWEVAASFDPASRNRRRRYPWGDEPPDPTRANLWSEEAHWAPAPVGAYSRGASALGVEQLLGDVWEWTASDFQAWPGFRAFPYREYSEVFFGPSFKVLRGGSWATHPAAIRNTFRNWDYPIRRQIFAGFRTARDA